MARKENKFAGLPITSIAVDQGSTNYSPWAKSTPMPIFINVTGTKPCSFAYVLPMAILLYDGRIK